MTDLFAYEDEDIQELCEQSRRAIREAAKDMVGGAIKIEGLRMPSNVSVTSGREVEEFVDEHTRKQEAVSLLQPDSTPKSEPAPDK